MQGYEKKIFSCEKPTLPFSSASNGGYGSTTEAFIFSLRNEEAIGPFKSKVKEDRESEAIYRSSDCGPVFGEVDIKIRDEANTNQRSYTDFGEIYDAPTGVRHRKNILAGTHHFTPDEWEVFYLA